LVMSGAEGLRFKQGAESYDRGNETRGVGRV
jgi:hypothetical protein